MFGEEFKTISGNNAVKFEADLKEFLCTFKAGVLCD